MIKTTKKAAKSAPVRSRSSATDEILAADCARRLGITQQSLGMWASRPGAPARADGVNVLVKWPAFARWREQELVRQAKEEAAPPSLLEAQTRRALAQAKTAELDLAERQGQLVSIEDYGTALGRILDREMARLRALPVRLSQFGPEVESAVETEIERMVQEMSEFDEDVLEEAA